MARINTRTHIYPMNKINTAIQVYFSGNFLNKWTT